MILLLSLLKKQTEPEHKNWPDDLTMATCVQSRHCYFLITIIKTFHNTFSSLQNWPHRFHRFFLLFHPSPLQLLHFHHQFSVPNTNLFLCTNSQLLSTEPVSSASSVPEHLLLHIHTLSRHTSAFKHQHQHNPFDFNRKSTTTSITAI